MHGSSSVVALVLLPLTMMSIFLDALLQLGIPAGVAKVVNEQFAKVESKAAHLVGLQQKLAQMRAQMDGLQLQV